MSSEAASSSESTADEVVDETIPPIYVEKARLQLNEYPAVRAIKIKQLRAMVESNKALSIAATDRYMLRYLRHRKFDVSRAYDRIVEHYTVRREHSDMFGNYLPSSVQEVMDTGMINVLNDRDKDGRKILILRPAKWQKSKFSPMEGAKAVIMVVDCLLNSEITQINGINLTIDMTETTWSQTSDLSSCVTKFREIACQTMPVRIGSINILYGTDIFKYIYRAVTASMKRKLADRIDNFEDNIDAYHQKVCPAVDGAPGPEILPVGSVFYGTGTVTLPTDEFTKEFFNSESHFMCVGKNRLDDVNKNLFSFGSLKDDAILAMRTPGSIRKILFE